MNSPLSIKGFSAVAPDFPEIVGLPLYPFAEALFKALEERSDIVGRRVSTSYPYPAEGRGFCSVQEHKLEHFLILEDLDDNLNSICDEFINQYDMPNYWNFDSLLSKAVELLGLPDECKVEKLSSGNYGRTIALWAVERAVMLSLLSYYEAKSRNGRFKVTYMIGGAGNEATAQAAYMSAVRDLTEKTSTYTSLGNSPPICDEYIASKSSSGNYYSGTLRELKKMEWIGSNDALSDLRHEFILYMGTRGNGVYSAYGSPFETEGQNIVRGTMENGLFYEKQIIPTPFPLDAYVTCGWRVGSSGMRTALYLKPDDYFQYGMSWGDSA